MPCSMRNTNLLARRKGHSGTPAVKPVRLRDPNRHALLRYGYIDDDWTPQSLTERLSYVNKLLAIHTVYKKYEFENRVKTLRSKTERLKEDCRQGYIKLKNLSGDDTSHAIRIMLNNHSSMQRLYKKMPIHLVVENITQCTFAMRKERDRLQCRLEQLKLKLQQLQNECLTLEHRIKNESQLGAEERLKTNILLKKIENSKVRFMAVKTINTTYKKMTQVLGADAIFYEPILRSLDDDIEDQSKMIDYIVDLGFPAVGRLRRLEHQFQQMEQARQGFLAEHPIFKPPVTKDVPQTEHVLEYPRYFRETESMLVLKKEAETIAKTIKKLKYTTTCSQAREICSRNKNIIKNTRDIKHQIDKDNINRKMIEKKLCYTGLLRSALVNNLTDEEVKRLEYIDLLRSTLNTEKDIENNTKEHLQNRAKAYVMLRLCLWNLVETLRSIDRGPYTFRHKFLRSSYLKLPLLNFDFFDIYSIPPNIYEEDINKIMRLVKRKLYKLMISYAAIPDSHQKTSILVDDYHQRFLTEYRSNAEKRKSLEYDGAISTDEERANVGVPTRKQIKSSSAKLLEEIHNAYY